MASEPIVMGGTYYWKLTATKDGAVWDLTGATITITFFTPSGTTKEYAAAILVAANGTAFYVNPTATFDAKGPWSVSWQVTQSGVIQETQEDSFTVYRSLASIA